MKATALLMAVMLGSVSAVAGEPTIESLAQKVEVLERQVEQLRSQLAALTEDSGDEPEPREGVHAPLVIELLPEGQIQVEDQDLQIEELAARIETLLEESPGHPIIIRADREVRFQDVVRIVELCHKAGGVTVSFATRVPEAGAEAEPQGAP